MRHEHSLFLGPDTVSAIESLLKAPEKLQNLAYTNAVIKETLRLFPIGTGVREASPRAVLKYEGREFPIDRGLAVTLQTHDVHYNPQYYSDPCSFKPDRWLDPNNEIPRSAFRAFSRGVRACTGQNLAMNELKIILAMTIRDYNFELAEIKPNATPKAAYTSLDTKFGDLVFQEMGIEAKPRGKVMMRVTKNSN